MQGHFYNLFKVFKCLLYNNDCYDVVLQMIDLYSNFLWDIVLKLKTKAI